MGRNTPNNISYRGPVNPRPPIPRNIMEEFVDRMNERNSTRLKEWFDNLRPQEQQQIRRIFRNAFTTVVLGAEAGIISLAELGAMKEQP